MPDERIMDLQARNRIDKLDRKVKSLEKGLDTAKEEIVKLRKGKAPLKEFSKYLMIGWPKPSICSADTTKKVVLESGPDFIDLRDDATGEIEDGTFDGRIAIYEFKEEVSE